MPAGGDDLPTRSLKTRDTLKLENGKERPYPVKRRPVAIGLYALAGPPYNRPSVVEERPSVVEELPLGCENVGVEDNHEVEVTGTPVRSTPDNAVGRVMLSSLVVPTPSTVLARHNGAPLITHYVASTTAV